MQEDSNKKHSHSRGTMEITGNIYNYTAHKNYHWEGNGAFEKTQGLGSRYYIDEGRSRDSYAINFKASRNWTGNTSEEGDEARPVNYTIRIWKRIS